MAGHELYMCWAAAGLLLLPAGRISAASDSGPNKPAATRPSARDCLTPQQWQRSQRSIDRALGWLATQQESDGSFPTYQTGLPAVSSFCLLAYLARGHQPGKGPYGEILHKGIDYVLSCQQSDGMLSLHFPFKYNPAQEHNPAHTAHYNHAICGLLLSEVYGMTRGEQSGRVRAAIEKALAYTRERQADARILEADEGGWRYVKPMRTDESDLSVTSWQLMFLRSCRNAGFDVPAADIDRALTYVHRCFDEKEGSFLYEFRNERRFSRGMAGAGVLSLSLGGQHQTAAALAAGDWILRSPRTRMQTGYGELDRFYYGTFYCSQAMFQLGGKYWDRYFPPVLDELTRNQQPDGSWPPEAPRDRIFGPTYSTSLAVLILATPYQLLPVFQR